MKPATSKMARKRKAKPETTSSEPKNIKLLETEVADPMSPPLCPLIKPKKGRKKKKLDSTEDIHDKLSDRFPILKNSDLVNKFMSVPLSNNQKGRIRQLMKDSLRGTSEIIMPEVIHTKILNILKSSNDLTDTDLRKVRILYNMLRTASLEPASHVADAEDPTKTDGKTKDLGKTKSVEKVKGARRHVVFVGNLPHDVTKQKLMDHFSDIAKDIVDIRLPKQEDEKQSAIAYIEIKDDHNYEYALSRHHTMLGNRRINVLYTTQLHTKISKAEAKSKSAKMIALQKQGKLLGSVPLARKRSQRRKKMKVAQAKEAAEKEAKHHGPQSTEKPKFWQGDVTA